LPWSYVEYELEWHTYYILLAVALDLDERSRYREYVLAGGKASDFPWSSEDHAGTREDRSPRFWNKVLGFFGGGAHGDIKYIAEPRGWEKIYKIEEKWSDGSIRTRYENEKGEDITAKVEAQIGSGEQVFMKTRG
jgi:hypothetical protein